MPWKFSSSCFSLLCTHSLDSINFLWDWHHAIRDEKLARKAAISCLELNLLRVELQAVVSDCLKQTEDCYAMVYLTVFLGQNIICYIPTGGSILFSHNSWEMFKRVKQFIFNYLLCLCHLAPL